MECFSRFLVSRRDVGAPIFPTHQQLLLSICIQSREGFIGVDRWRFSALQIVVFYGAYGRAIESENWGLCGFSLILEMESRERSVWQSVNFLMSWKMA